MNIEIETYGEITIWYTITYLKATGVDTFRMLTDREYLNRIADSMLISVEEELGHKLCRIESNYYAFVDGKFKIFCKKA